MKKVLFETENHAVAGVYYHTDTITQIWEDHDRTLRRGKKISIGEVSLEPEPNNLYDNTAIKVLIDNYHVGYIKKGSCTHVLQIINSGRIDHLSAVIYRGDDDDSGDPFYTVTVSIFAKPE